MILAALPRRRLASHLSFFTTFGPSSLLSLQPSTLLTPSCPPPLPQLQQVPSLSSVKIYMNMYLYIYVHVHINDQSHLCYMTPLLPWFLLFPRAQDGASAARQARGGGVSQRKQCGAYMPLTPPACQAHMPRPF
jgi:hypothetical protein